MLWEINSKEVVLSQLHNIETQNFLSVGLRIFIMFLNPLKKCMQLHKIHKHLKMSISMKI